MQAQEYGSLKEAISQLRDPGTTANLSNHDLQLLWNAGYRNLGDLQDTAKEDLVAIGLPRARACNLKPATFGENCQA